MPAAGRTGPSEPAVHEAGAQVGADSRSTDPSVVGRFSVDVSRGPTPKADGRSGHAPQVLAGHGLAQHAAEQVLGIVQ